MMVEASNLAKKIGTVESCDVLGVPRSSFYRWKNPCGEQRLEVRNSILTPPLKLSAEERQAVLDLLHSKRFIDKAPRTIYAILLDEDKVHHCSVSTMYRILYEEEELKERRNQKRHHNYAKPELIATKPNEVWSWDITKLKGPVKWSYYHLYVIMDIFSRYVVGWMVAPRESADLAETLIFEACQKQKIYRGQLTIHADRGSSMRSKTVAQLLSDLDVNKTHNRPYVSNDNPYSESQFKTLKYHYEFPERFGSIEDSRGFCQRFIAWYNGEHRHSGIAYLPPETVHYGMAEKMLLEREKVLNDAFIAKPNRFKGKTPASLDLPEAVWINKPHNESKGDD